MRRQFFRLFLSIVGIALLILVLQLLFFLLFNSFMEGRWRERIFDEFADSIESAVDDYDEEADSNIGKLIIDASSERISGVVFRDKTGHIVLTMGVSPRGIPVPQIIATYNTSNLQGYSNLRLKVSNEVDQSDVHEIEIGKPKYRLSIVVEPNGSPYINSFHKSLSFEELDEKGSESVSYPGNIAAEDVAGTIEIEVNGEVESYLDVLVFSLDYYNPTSYILKSVLNGFAVTFVIGVIIALIGAFVISKRNSKHVDHILSSLESLSKGEHGVKLEKTRVIEYSKINSAIEKLDEDLERHAESRKEWIRNISHDLNTPVASINILLECGLDGIYPIDKDLLLKIKEENDALMERIASVAYYSHLLSPDIKAKEEKVNMLDEIDTAISKIHGNFVLAIDPDIFALCDSTLLERAIEEVFKNAVSYSPSGSTIHINVVVKEKSILFTCENEGSLPHPEPNYFEPWARGDQSRTSGGSGMGLSIVYQIMKLNGGSVSIGEKSGKVVLTLTLKSAF